MQPGLGRVWPAPGPEDHVGISSMLAWEGACDPMPLCIGPRAIAAREHLPMLLGAQHLTPLHQQAPDIFVYLIRSLSFPEWLRLCSLRRAAIPHLKRQGRAGLEFQTLRPLQITGGHGARIPFSSILGKQGLQSPALPHEDSSCGRRAGGSECARRSFQQHASSTESRAGRRAHNRP